MKNNLASLGTRICVVTLGTGLLPLAASADGWWFEGGPVLRGGGELKVSGSSYTQQLNVHAAGASSAAGIGTLDAYSDRTYQDGYVKLDSGTLNPNTVGGPGNTWNWGYNNASQYNAGANTLSFHQQVASGYTTTSSTGATGTDHMLGAGLQLNTGTTVWQSGKWSFDIAFGFQAVWGIESHLSMSTYGETVGQQNITDTYDVSASTDPAVGFPGPQTSAGGYAGTYDGPASGQPSGWTAGNGAYPTIPNTPTSRTSTTTVSATAQNEINFRVRTDEYEVTFNPRIRYSFTDAFSLYAAPSAGIAYMSISAQRTEFFVQNTPGAPSQTLRSWYDSVNTDAWRFTTGATVGADWKFKSGYYVGVFGGYEWVVDEAHFGIGPNTITIDGSSYLVGLKVGKQF